MASCVCKLSLNHAQASNIKTYIIKKTGPSHYWLFTTHQVFYQAIMVFKSHYQSLVSCQLKMITLLVNQPYKKKITIDSVFVTEKERTVDKKKSRWCMYIVWQRIFIWPVLCIIVLLSLNMKDLCFFFSLQYTEVIYWCD